MTSPLGTAGTAGEGYRVAPAPHPSEPIPRPRSSSDDPREPGRRRDTEQQARDR